MKSCLGESTALRQGALGPGAIAFFVISAAGPLVAMAGGMPIAMLFGNGPGLPAMFLIATLVLLCFAAGYTAMAIEVQNAGAFYAFATRGLGPLAGGATGLIALLSYNAIQLGLYGLFGAAAKGLIDPFTSVALPWWLYSGGACVMVSILGYRQVDLSAKILGLLVAAEYLVVFTLDAAILVRGGAHGLDLRSFTPATAGSGSPAIGLMLCFAAFIGFEATTIYSEEARDPARTIPLATYFSVVLIGGFYTLSSWAIANGAGVDDILPMLRAMSDPTDLLFSLSSRYVGSDLVVAMRVLFVTSAFASLLAFHNAIARYLFAMGRDGLLPRALGRTHPTSQSPHIGSVTQSSLAGLCLIVFASSGADPVLIVFNLPSAIATLGIIMLMAITSAAAIIFLWSRQRPFVVGLTILALIAFCAIAGLATMRFDLLVGKADRTTAVLPLAIPVAGLAGIILAFRRRSARPVGSITRAGPAS